MKLIVKWNGSFGWPETKDFLSSSLARRKPKADKKETQKALGLGITVMI